MKFKLPWALCVLILLAALYAISYAVCICSLVMLIDSLDAFSLASFSGIVSLCFFGYGGYFASKHIPFTCSRQFIYFVLLITFMPAVLIWQSETSGGNIGWMLTLPHRFTALMMFYPLFDTPKSSFVLLVLQPLAVSFSHCVMMICFSLGIYWGKNKAH